MIIAYVQLSELKKHFEMPLNAITRDVYESERDNAPVYTSLMLFLFR